MAERVVSVTIRAKIDEYRKAMSQMAAETRAVGTEMEKLTQTREAFNQLGRTGVATGALIAAGLTVAVAKAADFDQAMSYVAATGEDARESMDALRQAALDAGASTVFSATESANAIEELSKAGLSASEILSGGLTGALDLAAAGGLGVAEAAEVAATTLQQFNLKGEDASHVADLLAAGAGKAMGDVRDMSAALNQSGLVAAQFGISVEETTGTLAAFAQAGLLGSDAGTSFRTMLLRLANPTDEVKDLMTELGIEAYDAQGQFVGLAGLAGELEGALDGMTQAQRDQTLAMIFGQDAIRAANILLREGEEGIRDWTSAVDDQGYAAETAATRLDNLKGDLEALQGALDTALITMGDAATGPLRAFTQGLTGVVDGFNELPAPAQQAVTWIAAISSAVTLGAGAYLLAVPKIVEFNESIKTLGPTAQRTARIVQVSATLMASAAAGIAIGVIGADALKSALEALGPAAEETANKVGTATDSVAIFEAALDRQRAGDNAELAAKQFAMLGESLDALAGKDSTSGGIFAASTARAIEDIGGVLGELAGTDLPRAQRQFQLLAEEAGLTEAQTASLLDLMPGFKDALVEQANALGINVEGSRLLEFALGDAASATGDQAVALEELQGAAVATEEEVNSLADAIRGFGSATFDTERAAISFNDAFATLDATLNEGGATLDLTTEKGRNTRSAMLEVAQSTNDYAASVAAMGGSTSEVQGILEAGRQKIIATRMALGDSRQAAEAYANQLVATPDSISTFVELSGVQSAENALNNLARDRYATIRTVVGPGVAPAPNVDRLNYAGNMYVGGKAQHFASGGIKSGIYAGVMGGIRNGADIFGELEMSVPWETYISGRQADRARNVAIWQRTGQMLGVQGGSQGGPVSVSLAGAEFVISVDGVPMRAVIQEQIVQASAASDRADNAGRRVR